MLRRFFAFMLAFLMLFSSVPTQALATMIHEESAEGELVVIGSDEIAAPVEVTEAALDAPSPLSETTVPETTVGETVSETTVAETVPETTVGETVAETIPETTVEETVPETTVEETVPETTVEETVPETTEETVEEIFDEDISNDPAQAVAEPALTGNWAADTLAIAQAYYAAGYTQETDEDGNPYTVFGDYFGDATNTSWNTHFIAYCLMQAGVDTNIFPVNISSAEAWKNSLQSAGYFYASNSGYTPVPGDLIFWSPYYPTSYNIGIVTETNKQMTADAGNQQGKIGTQMFWDGQILGYARIPNADGTLKQTLTAKVYTDGTFATEDTTASAVVEGNLPVNAEIRVFPVTLTAEQTASLSAIGEVVAAYGVKVFVNGEEYTGIINDPVSVKITSDVFGSGAAMMPYALADMQKLSASLSGSTLNLNVKIPTSFALVGISSTTVTNAAELKAAVEMGVPEITLGADITVDAANDNMTVSKAVKIELNGKNLVAAGDNALFNISGSGSLTMEDKGTETVTKSSGTNISRPDSVDDAALGSVAKDANGKAVLTYYVTDSTVTNPNGATQETRYQYTVSAAGMIENKTTQPLFVVNGGSLNINGGVYTGNLDGGYTGRGIVQNSGTTNLNGGYLAGFNVKPGRTDWSDLNDFGGAIRTTGGKLNIGSAVIAANQAISGAGIYAANTTVAMNNGVISGNKATGESSSVINDNGGPHFGGAGVYLGEGSSITVNGSGSYITNNSAPNANGYADGGAAIFARKWTTITINGGYITSNTVGGGGGAIRTIYGTETDYANMSSEAVKQAVEMAIYINGGYICGNFCRFAEGGGVSVNAGTGCWITGGYINNNVTMTQRDWGGGGLFNANGSYLELKNVLITENTALGLGGGVGGCSTGDIHLAVTEGGALFDNTGMGQNWSGEGSQKREDVEFAGENPNFDMDNADDYFCVHNSKVEPQMLGRGSCDWVGTCDNEKVAPPQRTVLEATKVMGLTSYAMAPGKMEARMNAKAYINGNYSNVHGGGIMCNGVLDVGTPMVGPLPAWLEVVGTKIFESKTPLTEGMFTFELLDAEGEIVTTGTNDQNGNIAFGQQLVFENPGTYTYTVREKAGTNEKIKYDDTVYTVIVTTVTDADGNICVDSVTVNGTAVAGITEGSFYVTLPDSTITFTNSTDDIDDEPGSVSISGRKVWVDNNNSDSTRPGSITVTLYVGEGENKKQVGQQVVTGPDWEFSFDVTDVENLEGAVFTIEENDVNGYRKDVVHPHLEFHAPSTSNEWNKISPCSPLQYTNTATAKTVVVAKTTEGVAVVWTPDALAVFEREIIQKSLLANVKELKGSTKEFVFLSGTGTSATYGITVDSSNLKFAKTSDWAMFWTGTYDRGSSASTEGVLTNTLTNMNVQAHKVWEDDNNRDGVRPATIEVELYANGKATGNKLVLSNRDSTTDSNSWHGQFLNLDKYDAAGNLINYTVKEVSVPAGYTVGYEQNEHDGSQVITNTHIPETTSITATKVWEDNSDQDGIRPASIVLTLYADGTPYVGADGKGRTVTLNGENNTWTATISGLPKYKNIGGQVSQIVYSFEETSVPEGYTKVVAGTTVTNKHTPEEIDISFQKTWVDNDDQDGKRPDSITVNLLANGTEVDSMTVTAETNYGGTFEELPKYANGEEIVYTLEEEPVEGYTTSITGSSANGFKITNTHEVEKTDLSVTKVWNDFGNQDNKRTPGIVIALYGNDKETPIATVTLNAANNWQHTWNDLDLYAGGNYVDYSVVEVAYIDAGGGTIEGVPNGYTVTHSYNNEAGSIVWTEATITNTLTPELTTLNIQKQWNDSSNQDGIRPESITLTLWKTTTQPTEITYVNGHVHYVVDPSDDSGWVKAVDSKGQPYVLTMTPTESGAWDADFKDLPKYEAGKLIYYAVTEEAVKGYTPSYELDPDTNVLYLKNTHETEDTQISVFKTWNDNNNQDGKRPASISVSLYGRDKVNPLETITLPDANGNWSYTWTELDKNYNGQPIIYTVVETAVPGYNVDAQGNAQTVSAAADASGKIVLTNTHIPEITSIPFNKVWADAGNQDGIRPASVTITLYANGVAKQTKTVTLAENWSGSFDNLPVYENGAKITYTVGEATADIPEDYTASVEGNTVTNTHKPEETTYTVSKVWDDNDNQDGIRPISISVQLLANGTAYGKPVDLKENNGWSYTWNQLPKFSNGNEVKYSVVEMTVVAGYQATIVGPTITNTHKPEKTEITVTKTWDDGNNQDGIRPETITVHLFADGVEVDTATYDATTNASYTFTNLDKYKNVNGKAVAIVYTITEDAVPGYETAISGLSITNTHKPEQTEFSVNKVWNDENNQDGVRPGFVTVQLYADGTPKGEAVTLNAGNSWSYNWTKLDKYKNVNGKAVLIKYTVDEIEVPEGYTKTVSGSTITNTHIPEETEITVSKVWDDANDQDGIRPDSVTAQLYADGVAQGEPVELSVYNRWSHEWTGLPKYKNVSNQGVAIVYTVKETAIPGYNLDDAGNPKSIIASPDADGNAVLTNVHIPEETEITVNKVWEGKNNDGTQPDAVRVTLYGNHKVIGNQFLDASNSWEYTWDMLPKYDEGDLVDYQILETGYKDGDTVIIGELPDGYSVNHSVEGSVVTVTNTYTPEKTFMNVQKTWDDTNNQDGMRVKAIQVTLMADGISTGKTAVLYEGNHWDYTFADLVKNSESGAAISYTIKETGYYNVYNPENPSDGLIPGVPKGYTDSYNEDYKLKTIELINTHEVELTSVPVQKVWVDENDQDGKRPEEITVTLYMNGEPAPAKIIANNTAVLSEENDWSYTFTDLPVHHGIAVDNVYTVKEETVSGYALTTSGDAKNGYVLTNTHVPEVVEIPVTKTWDDADNQDKVRPETITVILLADGEEADRQTISAAENWSYTFEKLPKYENGTEIIYTVDEVAVDGYETTIDGFHITNTHEPEVTTVTANKVWEDNGDQDGKRPASIKLHLLANGKHTGQTAVMKPDANGDWSYTWENLPKYDDGVEINYAVMEEAIGNGYYSTIDGYTITNTYAPEKTAINVWKNWDDGNNQDNLRPASITVELLTDGQPTGKTLTLNAAGHWYGSFSGLDKFAEGEEIVYSVKETSVAGYEPGTVTGSAEEGFTITNKREVETTEISVTKVWEDANDRDGLRPESVTVTLYRDGVPTEKTAELSEANSWTYTWDKLDVNHSQGTKYVYSVVETVPAGYEAITTGSADAGYVITNKRDTDTTSIPVIKVWDDELNQDGKRPASITVELLADGEKTGKTLTLTAAVNWQGIFTDLPVNNEKTDSAAEKQPIKYEVLETAVAEYNVDKNGVAQALTVPVVDGKVTITNTHDVQRTKLNVQKVWADFNDNDGKRPYAVVITLHENGKPTDKTLTLSSENGWKGAWDKMPRYSGGTWIAYTVVETGFYQTAEDLEKGNLTLGVPSGYEVSHSYDSTNTSSPVATVTNTYAPETVGLNVQKRWNDDNNREGIRPTEITVTLYRKVGETGTWNVVKDNDGNDITTVLNETNQWDADFLGLPKYSGGDLIYYNVVENPVAGYEAAYKLDPATGVVTITNTNPINKDVKIAVSKVWDDNNDQDGIRPEEIVVTLYANGIKTSSTKTLNETNGWKAEWTGLYEYYKGSKIIYTVVEENVPAGYKVLVTGNASTGFVITNTHNTETVDIPVAKIWDDNNNQDGIRPESITVTLLANGKPTSKVLTLDVEHLWQGSFTGLDKYADGAEIEYSIQEAVVEGYNVDEDGKSQIQTAPVVDGKITITNVHAPEKTTLTAVKKWHDNDDQDGKRPASVTVHLLANGIHMGEEYTCVLNAENDWTYTWENLEKYVSGQLIRYTVYEEPVEFKKSEIEAEAEITPASIENYVADYVRDSETQITINNRYTPETTAIKAVKVWDDDNNRDGLRSKTVDVKLLANGKDTELVMTMEEANNWTVTWADLPKYEDHGKLIEYTVEEVRVPTGYVCNVINYENVDTTYILTNTHTPVTTGVKVTKTWVDDNNNDGMRPDGLIVQLYADGTAVEGGRVILSDLNNWTHTFQSTEEMPLYIYSHGKLITYYVQEIGYVSNGVEHSGMPEGYEGKTALGENSYSIAITNTRASVKTALTVKKVWNDGNNADGVRPTSIQVTLLKNETEVETVTLNKENNWTYTWNDLYKYAGGVEVKYTVRESAVGTYTTDYAYTTAADGKTILATVTNSYTPTGKWFAIQKIWNDKNNAEGHRPTAVTVQIYKNDVAYGDPIVLSAANNWQSPMLLPVYENGVAIKWTIKEINIPRYYSVSYDQNTMTVTNTIQSKEVPKTGDDSNLLLWVGLLGLCGAGAATVLFVDKKKKRGK